VRTRVFWKFFAGFFLFSVFLALVFYFLIIGQARDFYLLAKEESLVKLGSVINFELAGVWPGLDEASLQETIQRKGGQAKVRLTVVDTRGRVLADSQTDPSGMQNHADRPEIAAALSGISRVETRFSHTLRQNMMYHALPVKIGEKTVAVLRLSLFVHDIDKMFLPWRLRVTFLLLVLIGISLIFSLSLSRNLTRPIQDLARAARQVASGDLGGHVRTRRRDEIGQLAFDFNAMVDGQREMVEKVRYGQQELEAILASISDGLLVIDPRERIVRAGPRFRRLVADPDPIGKTYWQVLRSKVFDGLIEQSATGKTVHAEIEIGQRLFLASLSPLPGAGGTVVTFHDLSETRRLEKQKKDFVANVSHELRTPLTAIKGYAETLSEESSGTARNYLDVILRHTDRLIDLTADLLTLSELEEKQRQPSLENIDWPEMLSRVRSLFEKRIRKKNLVLQIDLADEIQGLVFQGDPFRLEQLLINLLDNAVNYTEKGGVSIAISVRAGRLSIQVRDSGIGIAAEHLPHLFERFYVTDKARSRQTGGTGLGLSIVKHIVEMHNGTIGVESAPGSGTTFTVDLPVPAG